jgi:hypothetical protein
MITVDLNDHDLVTLIAALELAAKNAHTQYQKSQYIKLKNTLKKNVIGE